MRPENFFSLDSAEGGLARDLTPGIGTTLFNGDQAMTSVVRSDPNVSGVLHDHPEEQWGCCVSGGGVRIQGDLEVLVAPGDFWRTPGGVSHRMEAGPEGMVVIDIFAPPRKAYQTPGSGFGTG